MTTTTSAVGSGVRELTIRGVVLGGLITLVFTAANVYLGLKVGITFATSIPAAVISMALLRYVAGHTIVENNIVQTIASAAGALAAIIFVLPGLVMIGWWSGFPYWTTAALCGVGGILGVMFSIPLRRALVTGSDLPYPEGVACAEVLKVGEGGAAAEDNRTGLGVILLGALTAAAYSLLASLKLISNALQTAFRVGSGGTMAGASLSLALIGVGHLVGITVGIAMVVGLLISFGIVLPIRSAGQLAPGSNLSDVVNTVFTDDVRFVGAGAIAVAAVWTVLKILGPIFRGIRDAAVSARARRGGGTLEIVERDIPINIVGIVVLVLLVPIGLLLGDFAGAIGGSTAALITTSLLFILVLGLSIASVCGYMAGLIGSSNSPISGVGILVVIAAAPLLKVVHGAPSGDQTLPLIAFTLFTASVVFGLATIANDNLQDLKTGQLVGATPWKQQVALVIGVVFGALVIPPILQVLREAFGFQGMPGAGADALAAPQAALISSLAKGVFGGDLDWNLIGVGALIGVAVVAVDEVLGRTTRRLRLPPLAVGMGMYLPIALTVMIPIGAAVGRAYDTYAVRAGGDVERRRRLGILLATGLIVGESLYGVGFAAVVAATGDDAPLAIVGDGFLHPSEWLGAILFVAVIAGLYLQTRRKAATEPAVPPVPSHPEDPNEPLGPR